jgi:hypothetical protein
MAALGAIVGVVGSIVSAVGAAKQGQAAAAAGEAERNAQYFQAQQQERQGARVLAKETREAEQTRKEGEVAMSRVAALAPHDMLSPSIIDIQGKLAQETEYRSGLQTAAGLADQRHMMDQANASRYAGDIAKMKGDAARKNSMFEALGIGLGGLGKIAGSVGGGGGGGGGYKSSRYDFG